MKASRALAMLLPIAFLTILTSPLIHAVLHEQCTACLVHAATSNTEKGVWETVFSMKDPAGDDNGPHTYVYPKLKAYEKGVLDLTGFTSRYNRRVGIEFIVNLSKIGDNIYNYSVGFSLQNIQIYVHAMDNVPGSIFTYGLNTVIRGVDAWQFALILPAEAPPWHARVVLIYANGSVLRNPSGLNVSVKGNSIMIYVPMKYVKTWVNNMEHWRYVVAVTAFDPHRPFGVMRVDVVPAKYAIGGAEPMALAAGIAPDIMDLLAPNSSIQYRILNSYDKQVGAPAVLAAVPYVHNHILPHPPRTVTVTTTSTVSTTLTHYVYSTITTTSIMLHEYYGRMTWGLIGLVILLVLVLAAVAGRCRGSALHAK